MWLSYHCIIPRSSRSHATTRHLSAQSRASSRRRSRSCSRSSEHTQNCSSSCMMRRNVHCRWACLSAGEGYVQQRSRHDMSPVKPVLCLQGLELHCTPAGLFLCHTLHIKLSLSTLRAKLCAWTAICHACFLDHATLAPYLHPSTQHF